MAASAIKSEREIEREIPLAEKKGTNQPLTVDWPIGAPQQREERKAGENKNKLAILALPRSSFFTLGVPPPAPRRAASPPLWWGIEF